MVRCVPGWVKIGAGARSVAPLSLYSVVPAHRHAHQCPAKTPWGPRHHLICVLTAHFPCSAPPCPIFGAFVACFAFTVSSPSRIVILCAFSVAVPAEDCFAILCRPLFAALLSAAAINFVAAGLVTLLRPPSLPC